MPVSPGVPAEELEVAEQEIEADAPGDRRERQVVPLHPQRDEAEEQRQREREREADRKVEPWRQRVLRARGSPSCTRRCRRTPPARTTSARRRRSAARGRARRCCRGRCSCRASPRTAARAAARRPAPRRTRRPSAPTRRTCSLGVRRRLTLRTPRRPPLPASPHRDACGLLAPSLTRPPPWWCVVRLRHSSTGMISVNTITSLKPLAQNDAKASSSPTSSAPAAASG